MRIVSLEMVTPEMILAKSIRKGAQIYIQKGQKNINRYTRNLSNLGINYIYIDDGESDGIEIPDIVSAETRDRCKDTLRSSIEELHTRKHLDVPKLEESLDPLMDQVFKNFDVQISLVDISIADEYTFSHSVSATVYALIIGKELNYSKVQLEKLAMGMLIHDVGKTEIDNHIMFKKGRLTDEEYEYVKSHVIRGYHAIENSGQLTELSKQIVLTHHERMDGSGYPQGLKGDQIPEFGRIAAIADVYDALTADRCYRKRWSPEEAMNFLLERADKEFDSRLLQLFIQHIAMYPNGSMVALSDGRIGLVKEQNTSMAMRPVIRIIKEANGERPDAFYDVNLMESLNVTITEAQLETVDV